MLRVTTNVLTEKHPKQGKSFKDSFILVTNLAFQSIMTDSQIKNAP